MADNKMGPNLQAGAGFFAKRVQKSLNRAQEKVLQKLGKTMETKDEQFELCFQNLNKQQIDGTRLFKDVKAYYTAVKAVHETSKRLSLTLRDIYETDWMGVQDLAVITESEDLLWNDFEEKLCDQIVRPMENYTSQFPEVKERVAKRGRKLVDYDSARHHLEALQSTKKKDEAKIYKAEEEFNKAQNVFEEINNELREELPVLYQSRIGCYVTVFENISNLRDVFYKEMSVLNRELYNVMKKLENEHSDKAFIIKGLNSTTTKSKKRKSLVISNPIPCNTAFPADHVSLSSSTENGKEPASSNLVHQSSSTSEESIQPEGSSVCSRDTTSSDTDQSSSGTSTPNRNSACEIKEGDMNTKVQSQKEAESHSDHSDTVGSKLEAPGQEVSNINKATEDGGPTEEAKTKQTPVAAPRVSFRSTANRPLVSERLEETEDASVSQEATETTDDLSSHNPPGFLYKGVALESCAASADGLLQFEKGDIIMVLAGEPPEDGLLQGIREESWNLHQDVETSIGFFPESLIIPVQRE